MLSNGDYYVLNGGITPSGFTNKFNSKENTISISEGGNSCGYVNYNTVKFWSGGHNYTLTKLDLESIYLYQRLKALENAIMALRVGSGLPNIQKSRLEEFTVSYPKITEQKKIGALFAGLDKLITLHQRKDFQTTRGLKYGKQLQKNRPFLEILCFLDSNL